MDKGCWVGALELIKSYLHKRTQCVKEHNQQSDGLNYIAVVPQGSIRTAFDLPSVCSEVEIQLIYADDTVIYTHDGSNRL